MSTLISSSSRVQYLRVRQDYSRHSGVASPEMPDFDAEPRECCQCVDDDSNPVTDVMVTVAGIGTRLDRAVDAVCLRDWLVFAQICASPMSVPGTTSKNFLPAATPNRRSRGLCQRVLIPVWVFSLL